MTYDSDNKLSYVQDKNPSAWDTKAVVYISRELKQAARRAGINLSKFTRQKLLEELAYRGVEVETPEPDLIIETACPMCSFKQQTTTIRTVQCKKCGRRYLVFGRRRSRVTQIIRGSNALLQQKRRALRPMPRIGEA
jgi:hypothetical protein